ncbi:hypothetical protein J3A78_003484 [Streptomyces sp. PvR006]|uniref:hypothetical protein n=1 Tax=Streptomyces sp. PvR006 TaxID=2817860 RepID=UPI001AE1D27A|nr:hypothetical protein [Streptomyces sp. PvR006]MBP2583006.1 hypothetical protein [Streptomyces sp. PvR006]
MTEPEAFEFRLSTDGYRRIAFYDPGNGPWFMPVANMQGQFVDHASPELDGWTRYLPQEQAAAEVLRIVTEYVIESNDVGGLDCNDLADRLAAAGYPLPDEEDED